MLAHSDKGVCVAVIDRVDGASAPVTTCASARDVSHTHPILSLEVWLHVSGGEGATTTPHA